MILKKNIGLVFLFIVSKFWLGRKNNIGTNTNFSFYKFSEFFYFNNRYGIFSVALRILFLYWKNKCRFSGAFFCHFGKIVWFLYRKNITFTYTIYIQTELGNIDFTKYLVYVGNTVFTIFSWEFFFSRTGIGQYLSIAGFDIIANLYIITELFFVGTV